MNTQFYAVARAEAQRLANDAAALMPEYAKKGGCDWGVEQVAYDGTYNIRRLPLPENRQGHELTLEIVMPEINRF